MLELNETQILNSFFFAWFRAGMPLPRIETRFQFEQSDEPEHEEPEHEEEEELVVCRRLPAEVVEMIVDWAEQWRLARIKDYYYSRFMAKRRLSLHRSCSRLQMYMRELKSFQFKHRTLNEPPTLLAFLKDAKRCQQKYDYHTFKGICF